MKGHIAALNVTLVGAHFQLDALSGREYFSASFLWHAVVAKALARKDE
jgi:hypothetical protein